MLCQKLFGLVCCCLAFSSNLTSLLCNYWLVNFGSDLFNEGTWQRCTNSTCIRLTGREYILAINGMVILSTCMLVFGIVLSFLTFFDSRVGCVTASLAACILEVLSVILLFTGLLVYTTATIYNILNSTYKFDWALVLSWISVTLLIVAGTSHCLVHKATPQTSYESMQEGDAINCRG
ncbi:uncharacterized protein LOC143933114 [Lithobates pipiens]